MQIKGSTSQEKRNGGARLRLLQGGRCGGPKPGPVTVADAAGLLQRHRRRLSGRERRIVADVLAADRCATPADHARLQKALARLRERGLVS